MKRKMKFFITCIVLFALSANVKAYAFSDYTYSNWNDTIPAPPAYTLQQSISGLELGIGKLEKPTDCFVQNGKVYIADQNNIIICDMNFKMLSKITEFENNGQKDKITAPSGLFVTTSGDIYVAEPEKSRILHFNSDLTLNRVIGKPDISGLEDIVYKPKKLVVDNVGRIFVVAQNVYEGIIELNPDGTFSKFFGVNKVRFTPLDLLWRAIATEKQREKMELWLPTDYSNITLDNDGFVFATVRAADETEPIKKLNAKGDDILRSIGKNRPSGDVVVNTKGYGIPVGKSEIISIDCNDYGMYIALDAKRGRIFSYNEDGYLMYVFGGKGDRNGLFQNPVDIEFLDERILITDQNNNTIDVFEPTLYGSTINQGCKYQFHADYENASKQWEQVISINQNFDYAYTGIGKTELRNKNYPEAVLAFKSGEDKEYYSKAYKKLRDQTLEEHFELIFIAILIVIILIVTIKFIKSRNKYRRREDDE